LPGATKDHAVFGPAEGLQYRVCRIETPTHRFHAIWVRLRRSRSNDDPRELALTRGSIRSKVQRFNCSTAPLRSSRSTGFKLVQRSMVQLEDKLDWTGTSHLRIPEASKDKARLEVQLATSSLMWIPRIRTLSGFDLLLGTSSLRCPSA
jgi:hypothetical protein